MKLRTKILWISSLALILASLLAGILILRVSQRNLKSAAISRAYQGFYEMSGELDQILSQAISLETKRSYLEYFFKTQRNNLNICFEDRQNEDGTSAYDAVYNQTILDAGTLIKLDYKNMAWVQGNSGEYAYFTWEGQDYAVFCKVYQNRFLVYQLVSMKAVNDDVRQLAGRMLLIVMGVAASAVVILFFVLRSVLQPLQELNETTKRMAEGDYRQRIDVQRRDELGQLEDSFNKMAQAVETSVRNLEESEKKKTMFMGSLTHELKTPMTAISGYAQTLLTARISRENQEAALYYIYQECTRLERLSKKMMKLLELDQDTDIPLMDTPVEQIFQAAAASCEKMLQDKQITLECIQHGEHFMMDSDLMTDLLINLIDNGIKASDKGGKIILRAEGNRIEVQDFGKGIPEGEQEKILEPFYMVDKSRSRKSGGAGLGLALSALIAGKHHIDMRIESKEGEGTLIILEF